jgi:hypothetical protein
MTIAGVILLILGGVASTLVFTGNVPQALNPVFNPVPSFTWIIIAAIGAVLIYINRRPGN